MTFVANYDVCRLEGLSQYLWEEKISCLSQGRKCSAVSDKEDKSQIITSVKITIFRQHNAKIPITKIKSAHLTRGFFET